MVASDPMLLTLPRPVHAGFEFKNAHDFVPPPPISTQRPSVVKVDQEALPTLQAGVPEKMGTPHRGLPPPSAMTLPEPRPIPPPLTAPFTGMPEPPRQWQGAEESMHRWLLTKAEEEKRKQEEERTRQEALKVEQRRIEQSILMEALARGIPPQLVPIIFAGIGTHSVANLSIEWLQQYNNSLAVATQQQLTGHTQSSGSPEMRRERLVGPGPPPQYAPAQAGSAGPPPLGPPMAQPSAPYSYGSNPMSPSVASRQPSGPPSSGMRGPLQQVLPRISTSEQHQLPPPTAGPGAVQPPPMQGGQQEPQASSPSAGIFFHHWVPPSSQPSGGNQPPTPSGKRQK